MYGLIYLPRTLVIVTLLVFFFTMETWELLEISNDFSTKHDSSAQTAIIGTGTENRISIRANLNFLSFSWNLFNCYKPLDSEYLARLHLLGNEKYESVCINNENELK